MNRLREAGFYSNIKLGGKNIRGRIVIPSGVRCACPSAIERYFDIDAVGVITTKSISMAPREGYKEPIFAQYGEKSYINAVGLANGGACLFKEEIAKIKIPENKFLLVSIFGSDLDEFYSAAEILADVADGFELNMSCPHAKGYGLQIGGDLELTARITQKIAESFSLPVFVKLSASIPSLVKTAEAVIKCGAYGIVATNTVGPGLAFVSSEPVLSNRYGGISGEAIRPLGLKAVSDIRQAIGSEPVIIGMGGIFSAADIEDYHRAGADFFGVGSALTNLTTEQSRSYLNSLNYELTGIGKPFSLKPVTNMSYRRCVVKENIPLTEGLHKIKLDGDILEPFSEDADVAGKFFFLMIPGLGEKPFSIYSCGDKTFIVKNVGSFTSNLTKLPVGSEVFLRGPYGKEPELYVDAVINFVAGGTGIAPVFEMANKYCANNRVRFFFGGKSRDDIFDVSRYEKLGEVNIATEDGSEGKMGFVTGLLADYPFIKNENNVFINVGPRAMIEAACAIEREITPVDRIWASIERHTSCGVGICGKCATSAGAISCVDGPFLRMTETL